MKLFVFTTLLTFAGAEEILLDGPQNTLSIVGSNVTLQCLSPLRNCRGVEWLKYIPDSNPATIFRESVGIYGTFRGRFGFDNSSGCHLVINSVELTDSGRFICRVFISSQQIDKSADLIILSAYIEPKCTIYASLEDTAEEDGVQLNCAVTYNGKIRPSIAWKGVEDAPAAIQHGETTIRSYFVAASVPEVPSYTCMTSISSYDIENPIAGSATNVPYTTTCETPTVNVLHSVRDAQLWPLLYSYPPESVIACTARGHPPAEFKWQEMESDGNWTDILNQTGHIFTTTNVSSKRYRCFAMNALRGKNYVATSHALLVGSPVGDDDDDSHTTTALTPPPVNFLVAFAAAVVLDFLLLAVLFDVCFCVRSFPGYQWRHSGKKSKNETR